jgi:hypothetical protein
VPPKQIAKEEEKEKKEKPNPSPQAAKKRKEKNLWPAAYRTHGERERERTHWKSLCQQAN